MPGRKDLAKIHIAKKELRLDDASYRGILKERYNQQSAKNLTELQVADLIALFRKKGWRNASAGQRGLIRVLWHQLAMSGEVKHANETALAAFLDHATGKNQLERLTSYEASRVIEMLKKWLGRIEAPRLLH